MELLCIWTADCVWHRKIPLVWKRAKVSQKQQHHVSLCCCCFFQKCFLLFTDNYYDNKKLIWLISVGSLWTWKRKFGTRSVMTLSARASDPPVCGNPKNFTSLKPCTLTNIWMLQVTHCLRRSASATSWRWSVIPTQPSCVHFPVNPQCLFLADRMMKVRRT